MFYSKYGKRLFDLCCACLAIIIASPLWSLVAVLIKIESKGPIFFIQERLGQYGGVFFAYKFRTMTAIIRTHHREIIGRDTDVTRVGYWLRRFKLDELPQLLNVLKGDMSLVGPRPPLPDQIHQYDETSRMRLLVKPGLTGLAQIHGGIFLSWQERWSYDIQYIKLLSFKMDLWIMYRTVMVVFCGEEKFYKSPAANSL
jgi:undecaprenyl phosphate N,N'-diacetylbacillosamine 1-phosphate transferase